MRKHNICPECGSEVRAFIVAKILPLSTSMGYLHEVPNCAIVLIACTVCSSDWSFYKHMNVGESDESIKDRAIETWYAGNQLDEFKPERFGGTSPALMFGELNELKTLPYGR